MSDKDIDPNQTVWVRLTDDRQWGVYIHFDPTCSNILKLDKNTVKGMPFSEAEKLKKKHCSYCKSKARLGVRGMQSYGVPQGAAQLLVTTNEEIFGGAKIEAPPEVAEAASEEEPSAPSNEIEVVELPPDLEDNDDEE